ncbi:MAG: hypothetical protein JNL90_00060 [Planctomycetes bacterium]|nr:hypothetical protein [Planctomycetota bacterium]
MRWRRSVQIASRVALPVACALATLRAPPPLLAAPAARAPAVAVQHYYNGVSFDQLVGRADVIVLAKVSRVDRVEGAVAETPDEPWLVAVEPRIAEAAVLETWKGRPGAAVRYRAKWSSHGDATDAVPRETVVLFLSAPDEEGCRTILHGGDGRLQVLSEGAARFAVIDPDRVRLPTPDAPRVEVPGSTPSQVDVDRLLERSAAQRMELDTLRERTLERVKRRETLETLVAAANLIVVATVEQRFGGERVAVRVDERWKGALEGEEQLIVRGSFSWPLEEIPFAEQQRQLLFLGAPLSDGSRPTVGNDRGRMTIVKVAGVPLGVAWVVDVDWPRDLRVDEEPDRPGLLYGRIELARLERRIDALDD